jgi:2-polyprenyl-3-methyl-5-hydroxy-6-metoxy-1,4-benzoquinol methylase
MRDLAPCCICKHVDRKVLFPSRAADILDPETINPYSGHYQINECGGCGLIYSSPIFDDHIVRAIYANYSETNVANEEIGNVRQTMSGYYKLATPYLTKKERILDIGCDIGLFLEVAEGDGFSELYGLEPVTVAREAAKQRLPHAVISGAFYEDADLPANSFDAIALIHVLDHLARPEQHLQRMWRHLKPGGVALAVVHNVESVLAAVTGERFPVFNFFHHYFFSKRSLRALFLSHGFEPLRIVSTKNVYSLAFFLERFPLVTPALRRELATASRRLGIGQMTLSLAVGNIGVVARRPESDRASVQ